MSISIDMKNKVLGKVSFDFTKDEIEGTISVTFTSTTDIMLAMAESMACNYNYSPTIKVPNEKDPSIADTIDNPETAQAHAMRRLVEFAADNFVMHENRKAEGAKEAALELAKDSI